MSSASWILQRLDGPSPCWKGLIDIAQSRAPDGPLDEAVGGIRGMTAVPHAGGESILLCWNPNVAGLSYMDVSFFKNVFMFRKIVGLRSKFNFEI